LNINILDTSATVKTEIEIKSAEKEKSTNAKNELNKENAKLSSNESTIKNSAPTLGQKEIKSKPSSPQKSLSQEKEDKDKIVVSPEKQNLEKASQPEKNSSSEQKRDTSPPKRDSSPPKSGKARPKSGKRQMSGSKKSSETDNDTMGTQIAEKMVENQPDAVPKLPQKESDENQKNEINTSCGPVIIIDESSSVMMEEDEEPTQPAEKDKIPSEIKNEAIKELKSDQTSNVKTEIISAVEKEAEKILNDANSTHKNSKTENPPAALSVIKVTKPSAPNSDLKSESTKEKLECETEKKINVPITEPLVQKAESAIVSTQAEIHQLDEKSENTNASPKKEVESLKPGSDKIQVENGDKMCSAKSTSNGVAYVLLDDEKNEAEILNEAKLKKKKPPAPAKKEKSVEKVDVAEKSEAANKRAPREVKKDDSKRNLKELKSKSEDRNGFKVRENKTSLKNRKPSLERAQEKSKSVSEEEHNSFKSSAQASLEEQNPGESSDASDRSKAADSGVMMIEPLNKDSPKNKQKSKGVVKVMSENDEKELFNGKPAKRVTPTSRDLTKINARNNKAQIEEDEKKAREIIRKRHEQSVVSVTQAVQVSTRK